MIANPEAFDHIFKTLFGMPPTKDDTPLCGVRLSDAWDFQGPRPPCQQCAAVREGLLTPNADSVPPRKGVTAWEIEPMEENGDEFFVLTFHHGLGKMTRLDLWAEEVRDLAQALLAALDSPGAQS